MKKLILIAISLGILCSCASTYPVKPLEPNAKIINRGVRDRFTHIVMFDVDGDRTPDYFEYYTCHPLFSDPSQLLIKQPDGDYLFGNHGCVRRGFSDHR